MHGLFCFVLFCFVFNFCRETRLSNSALKFSCMISVWPGICTKQKEKTNSDSDIVQFQVKDLQTEDATRDVDFATSLTEISTSWANVFVDVPGAMDSFKIALGKEPGGMYYKGGQIDARSIVYFVLFIFFTKIIDKIKN